MFTGIVECCGTITGIEKQGSNKRFRIQSPISSELKVDQSVSHDGVCLTVIRSTNHWHEADLIAETLSISKFSDSREGEKVNLERSMKLNDRFDGHLVQGHVDQVGECVNIQDKDGSRIISIWYRQTPANMIVEKGSICVNGVSLTCFDVKDSRFSVAIVPYTLEHTNIHQMKTGDKVNLEFDIIGKYINRLMAVK